MQLEGQTVYDERKMFLLKLNVELALVVLRCSFAERAGRFKTSWLELIVITRKKVLSRTNKRTQNYNNSKIYVLITLL